MGTERKHRSDSDLQARKPAATQKSSSAGAGASALAARNRAQVGAAVRTVDARSARIDASRLKQQVDTGETSGFKTDVTNAGGQLAQTVNPGQQQQGGEDDRQGIQTIGGKAKPKATVKLTGRWADTLQGGRWNSEGESGFIDMGHGVSVGPGMAGSGRDKVSEGDGDSGGEDDMSDKVDEDGNWTGTKEEAEEEAYRQAVGEDGYAATKNMTQEQRKEYWTQEAQRQALGTDDDGKGGGKAGMPRDDDMGGSGGPVIVGKQGKNEVKRHVITAGTDDKGDGRGDQQQGSGGPMNETMATGGQDKEMKHRDVGGAISFETALKQAKFTDPKLH